MKKLDFCKMTQEDFLKAAFKEAAEREIAVLEAMDIKMPEPTEEQRKKMRTLLDNCTAK